MKILFVSKGQNFHTSEYGVFKISLSGEWVNFKWNLVKIWKFYPYQRKHWRTQTAIFVHVMKESFQNFIDSLLLLCDPKSTG